MMVQYFVSCGTAVPGSGIMINDWLTTILGQNAKDKTPTPKTPNTKVSGISYIGVLSVALWPDTIPLSFSNCKPVLDWLSVQSVGVAKIMFHQTAHSGLCLRSFGSAHSHDCIRKLVNDFTAIYVCMILWCITPWYYFILQIYMYVTDQILLCLLPITKKSV